MKSSGNRAGLDWLKAGVVSLLLNIVLFLVIPGLTAVRPQKQQLEEMDQLITLTQVREPETEKEKPPEPPKPPEEQPKVENVVHRMVLPTQKLSLPFELNPRLPAIEGGVELPPIDTSLPQADMSGMFEVGALDAPLVGMSQMPPHYPQRAKRFAIQGWVKIEFVVNEEGRVENVKVLESQPKGTFERAVIRAVSHWRFRPGTIGGIPVKARVQQKIIFRVP
ncbi:energy transducer TonB [Desulforhopalus vacuolatus]|uniref:energy transducer TonB n=1 Tax=Desulforhopalus vacuolatus TaxID=40414 RepID=UPI001964979B|nr:energy transducer TonB [Desulforhopalus vacuolatus]MBM9520787.1 energy transducer TonB [Desulforhopalus vacuolatus]